MMRMNKPAYDCFNRTKFHWKENHSSGNMLCELFVYIELIKDNYEMDFLRSIRQRFGRCKELSVSGRFTISSRQVFQSERYSCSPRFDKLDKIISAPCNRGWDLSQDCIEGTRKQTSPTGCNRNFMKTKEVEAVMMLSLHLCWPAKRYCWIETMEHRGISKIKSLFCWSKEFQNPSKNVHPQSDTIHWTFQRGYVIFNRRFEKSLNFLITKLNILNF